MKKKFYNGWLASPYELFDLVQINYRISDDLILDLWDYVTLSYNETTRLKNLVNDLNAELSHLRSENRFLLDQINDPANE